MSDELDMRILQRDDLLLDALGARSGGTADGDIAVTLLAALAADVDAQPVPLADALAVLAAVGVEPAGDGESATVLFPVADRVPHANGHHRAINGAARPLGSVSAGSVRRHRRHAHRAAIAAGVITAAVFAGSVAAAVTGDPLAPIRKVIQTVTGVEPVEPEAVDRRLEGAGDALQRGDTQTAEELIGEAQTKITELSPEDAQRLEVALTELLRRLAEQTAANAETTTGPAASPEPSAEPSPASSDPPAEPSPQPTQDTEGPDPASEPGSEPADSPTPTENPQQESEPTEAPDGGLSGDEQTRNLPPPEDGAPGGSSDLGTQDAGSGNPTDSLGEERQNRPDGAPQDDGGGGEQGQDADEGPDGPDGPEGPAQGEEPDQGNPMTQEVAETVATAADMLLGVVETGVADALAPFAATFALFS